jgi:hypothetical protein
MNASILEFCAFLHGEENADPIELISYEWSLMSLRKAKCFDFITGFVTSGALFSCFY